MSECDFISFSPMGLVLIGYLKKKRHLEFDFYFIGDMEVS